jgi:hypothetical protein
VQRKSKNNYNLVELVATLCSEYTVSKDTYEVVEQCFDTLTEMIQGPCKQNQTEIANSNFMEYAKKILEEDG